jgi:hypothetical protein
MTELEIKMFGELYQLRAELAEARRDAERYRWLRDNVSALDADAGENFVAVWYGLHPSHCSRQRTLDAAIDAARGAP